MSSWHSYPSIYNLGHRAIQDLLKGPVNTEEKIDGSQFSFGLFDVEAAADGSGPGIVGDYELKVRSKGAVMHPDAPEKMFAKGVEHVKSISHLLTPGWTYRGEYLAKPKHNALAYDRIPKGHVILFDINPGEEEYLSYEDKRAEAERLGLECVPLLFTGGIASVEEFRSFLESTSILGGQKIEGVVVKPLAYNLYGRDKKVLMGKFVSEAFKEVHSKTWGESNPLSGDIITTISSRLNTQARWQKALQHLRESGKIQDTVQDIGLLMKEIPEDVKRECEEEIKEYLFSWAWPHIRRSVSRGAPEWYKEHLLKLQFERDPESVPAFLEAKLEG